MLIALLISLFVFTCYISLCFKKKCMLNARICFTVKVLMLFSSYYKLILCLKQFHSHSVGDCLPLIALPSLYYCIFQ